MSNSYPAEYEQVIVEGFEVPKSPDSSYSNEYPLNEDDARDPPAIPPQLQHTLLHYPASRSNSETLPLPHNVNLNHLYIENREAPKSVVALGITHRFLSKYVTVVLYKPVQRGSSTSIGRGRQYCCPCNTNNLCSASYRYEDSCLLSEDEC